MMNKTGSKLTFLWIILEICLSSNCEHSWILWLVANYLQGKLVDVNKCESGGSQAIVNFTVTDKYYLQNKISPQFLWKSLQIKYLG